MDKEHQEKTKCVPCLHMCGNAKELCRQYKGVCVCVWQCDMCGVVCVEYGELWNEGEGMAGRGREVGR